MNQTTSALGRLTAVAGLLVSAGCATTAVAPQSAQDDTTFSTAAGEAGYHLLLAELAVERGLFPEAAREYRNAAQLSDDVDVAQRATELALEVGSADDALASARRWVELDPQSLVARQRLAVLLLDNGQTGQAGEHLRQLLGLFSDDSEQAFLQLSGVLMDAPPEPAMKAMARLLADHQAVAAAHYAMALMAFRNQLYPLAFEHAQRASGLRPDWYQPGVLEARILVAQGEVDAGLERAGEIASVSPDPTVRLEYALLLAGADREGEARLELDLLLSEHPRMAGALRAAGLLELRRGDLDAAQLHFTSLLATGRNIWEAFFYLGSIAEERGQFARAIRYYSQVRDEDLAIPSQVRAAMLYQRLGEPERAIEHLTGFGRESPQFDAELSIAAAEMLAVRGETDRALTLYGDILQRHPGHRNARFARAFLYESLDEVDLAIVELRALVDETPDDPTALNALGYTLADRTNRTREAYRLIRRAYQLDGDNPAIIDSMGWVEFRRGNPDKALQHLQRAYELLPDPEVAAHLGEVLYTLGRVDEAEAVIEQALQNHIGHEALVETRERLGL